MQKDRVAAFYLSAIITILVIGSMIIIHEQDTDFKALLNRLTGHHWLTKSVFAAILFPLLSIAFYFVFGSEKARRTLKADDPRIWSLILVGVTLAFILGSFINYTLHYFSV